MPSGEASERAVLEQELRLQMMCEYTPAEISRLRAVVSEQGSRLYALRSESAAKDAEIARLKEQASKFLNFPMQIFAHKHLDPKCVTEGCHSLFLDEARAQLAAAQSDLEAAMQLVDAQRRAIERRAIKHREELAAAQRDTARRILKLADEHLYRGGTSLFEQAVEREFGLAEPSQEGATAEIVPATEPEKEKS